LTGGLLIVTTATSPSLESVTKSLMVRIPFCQSGFCQAR
jgi:hypothetical protein